MTWLSALPTRTTRWLAYNRDLLGVGALALCLLPLVPRGHWIARDDLVPWSILVLSVASAIRAPGGAVPPNPALTVRREGGALARVVRALLPVVLGSWYEGGRALAEGLLGTSPGRAAEVALSAAGLTLAWCALRLGASRHGETAWRDPASPGAWTWGWIAPLALVSVGAGLLGARVGWAGAAALVGACFVALPLAEQRRQNLWQRAQAADIDPIERVKPLLVDALGPSLCLVVLHLSAATPQSNAQTSGFDEAGLVTVAILSWAIALWPRPQPLARLVLLHEVRPAGGADPARGWTPGAAQAAPRGSLRLSPVALRRTRIFHPWWVPVQGGRVPGNDTPSVVLWPADERATSDHVLGEAAFLSDGSGQVQTDEVTIRLTETPGTVEARRVEELGQRRVVVLRAFGSTTRRRSRWRWSPTLAEDAVQEARAGVDELKLRDGDLLVLSSGGVARAYEVELGEILRERRDAERLRTPAVEDYTALRLAPPSADAEGSR